MRTTRQESIQAHNIDAALLARGVESTADNRLHQFYDLNADVGGPLKRDRVWWYTSFRDEQSQARYANFPIRPFETRLINYTGKLTVQLSANDKLIAYGQAGKKLQPYRQDTATIGGPGGSRSFGLFDNEDATANQDYIGWIWKGEYNRAFSSNLLMELRAGRVGYTWDSGVYTDEVRREDIGNRLVTGGNVKWIEDVNRNQVLGTFSTFRNGFGGTHNLKTGFELYRDTQERDQTGYPQNLLLEFNNGVAVAQRQYIPSSSINRLFAGGLYVTDSWHLGSRWNLNLGVRMDHYRSYLPAQSRPASPFATAASFAAVDDVITWNLPAPRFGVTYKIRRRRHDRRQGERRPLLVESRRQRRVLGEPEHRHRLRTLCLDRSQRGSRLSTDRAGTAAVSRRRRRPRARSEPREHLHRRARGLARSRAAAELRVAHRRGVAWPAPDAPDGQHRAAVRGVHRTGAGARSGSRRPRRNRRRWRAVFAVQPRRRRISGRFNNLVTNVDGDNDYYTWEVTANRRMTDGWSLMASYAITWNREHASSPGAAANPVRSANAPVNPNDLINAGSDGRYHFALWNAKVHAVIPGPWSLRFSPLVRAQSGQPFGRTFVASMNYGTQRILAEPLGTQQQDMVAILDLRTERLLRFGAAPFESAARSLQPAQCQSRRLSGLGIGHELSASVERHPAANRPLRREVRLVRTTHASSGAAVCIAARDCHRCGSIEAAASSPADRRRRLEARLRDAGGDAEPDRARTARRRLHAPSFGVPDGHARERLVVLDRRLPRGARTPRQQRVLPRRRQGEIPRHRRSQSAAGDREVGRPLADRADARRVAPCCRAQDAGGQLRVGRFGVPEPSHALRRRDPPFTVHAAGVARRGGADRGSRAGGASAVARDAHAVDLFLKVGLPRVDPAVTVLWLGGLDATAHEKGIGAPETIEVLRGVDAQIRRIEDGLKRAGVFEAYNLWITSDHGFSTYTGGADLSGAIQPFAGTLPDGSPRVVSSGGTIYVRDNNEPAIAGIVAALQRTSGVGAIFTRGGAARLARRTGPRHALLRCDSLESPALRADPVVARLE